MKAFIHQVVVMGSARTGKTSLVSQFLYTVFSPRYRPTVEDMHTVELDCQGIKHFVISEATTVGELHPSGIERSFNDEQHSSFLNLFSRRTK